MGKETIIHTDHRPLQYLQSPAKLQQSQHFRWMGFLQQFHLVIKYKKGIHNKVADMLSRTVINASTMLRHNPLYHEIYKEQYDKDGDFKYVYNALNHGNQQSNYDMNDNLLYHLGKICIPRDERVNVIREPHASLIYGHFFKP